MRTGQVDRNALHLLSPWWRFSEYEIKEGNILPRKDADLEEYDPWEEYLSSCSAADLIPPYQSLITLLRDVRFQPQEDGLGLIGQSQREITQWCKRFGLLGLLPHVAISMTLAPVAILERQSRDPAVELYVRTYVRAGGRWQSQLYGEGHSGKIIGPAIQQLREKGLLYEGSESSLEEEEFLGVTPGEMPAVLRAAQTGIPAEGVILQPLEYHPDLVSFDRQPFEKYWGKFFPKVPSSAKNAYQYPWPLHPEFWDIYAEPVEEFVQTATVFRNLLRRLYELSASPQETINRGQFDSRVRVLFALEGMLAGTAPLADGDEVDGFHLALRFPSLIAALGMMIVKDLEAGKTPQLCIECETPFLTSAYQARYCSSRCRNTAQQRRHRGKKQEFARQKQAEEKS